MLWLIDLSLDPYKSTYTNILAGFDDVSKNHAGFDDIINNHADFDVTDNHAEFDDDNKNYASFTSSPLILAELGPNFFTPPRNGSTDYLRTYSEYVYKINDPYSCLRKKGKYLRNWSIWQINAFQQPTKSVKSKTNSREN